MERFKAGETVYLVRAMGDEAPEGERMPFLDDRLTRFFRAKRAAIPELIIAATSLAAVESVFKKKRRRLSELKLSWHDSYPHLGTGRRCLHHCQRDPRDLQYEVQESKWRHQGRHFRRKLM